MTTRPGSWVPLSPGRAFERCRRLAAVVAVVDRDHLIAADRRSPWPDRGREQRCPVVVVVAAVVVVVEVSFEQCRKLLHQSFDPGVDTTKLYSSVSDATGE
jgi:hypothetical protein